MDTLESWRSGLARPASRLVLDPVHQVTAATCSWFGRVTLGEPQEEWPVSNGQLMWPLLQIVVRELPYRPPGLRDLALIRVFIDPAFLAETENGGADFYHPEDVSGSGWLLRASPTLDTLVPIVTPEHGSRIIAAPGHWELIPDDLPTWDELSRDAPQYQLDHYEDLEPKTHEGTKVGGWPFTIQSQLSWGPWDENPCNLEYQFQIDSDYDRGWMWGDNGTAYFGRGTGSHRDTWGMVWQCM